VTTTSHPEKEPTDVLNMFFPPITVLLGTVSVSIKIILSVHLVQRAKFYHNTQSTSCVVGYVFLNMEKGDNYVKDKKLPDQNVECSM